MELLERKKDDWFVLGLKGKLDAITSAGVWERLSCLIQQGERRVLLDCTNLDYISSAGLRVLFEAAFMLKEKGGTLDCCSVNTNIAKVFKIVDLQADIRIYASADDAMKH